MQFGQALKIFRTAAGLGLRELARRIGVSPSYLSQIENGKLKPPPAERIAQIAREIQISSRVLLELTERTKPEVLEYLHERPEVGDLVLALKNLQLNRREITNLTRALGSGRGLISDILAAQAAAPNPSQKAISELLDEDLVFPRSRCTDREEILAYLIHKVSQVHPSLQEEEILSSVLRRESEVSTVLGGGVALPHARLDLLDHSLLALARSEPGIEFPGTPNKKVYLVFLVLSPREGREHLQVLSQIAQVCHQPGVVGDLRKARGKREMLQILKRAMLVAA